MPRPIEGQLDGAGGHYAIVVSRYNNSVTSKLLDGAVATLAEHNIDDDAIDVVFTPGAWEIPLAAQKLADSRRYAAIICLGAVIRGETTHDQYINRQVSDSLGRIALQANLPVLFGLLTCNTLEQAVNRSGGAVGNKGAECAAAALEMASLMQKLDDLAGE